MSVPLSDVMSFPKLTQATFLLFQVFASEQIQSLSDIDPQVFSFMMESCIEGLKSSDGSISAQVAISIDYIFTFIVNQKLVHIPLKREHYLIGRCAENPNIITFIMRQLLELVLFDDHQSMWTFTRALLPLILANKEYYEYYITELVKGQLPELQATLQANVIKIMDNVEVNLHPRNRDKFTQQLINFRREVTNTMTLIHPTILATVA